MALCAACNERSSVVFCSECSVGDLCAQCDGGVHAVFKTHSRVPISQRPPTCVQHGRVVVKRCLADGALLCLECAAEPPHVKHGKEDISAAVKEMARVDEHLQTGTAELVLLGARCDAIEAETDRVKETITAHGERLKAMIDKRCAELLESVYAIQSAKLQRTCELQDSLNSAVDALKHIKMARAAREPKSSEARVGAKDTAKKEDINDILARQATAAVEEAGAAQRAAHEVFATPPTIAVGLTETAVAVDMINYVVGWVGVRPPRMHAVPGDAVTHQSATIAWIASEPPGTDYELEVAPAGKGLFKHT